MPHVIVKLWPGQSEAKKMWPAAKIAESVMDVFDYGEESVSVAIKNIKILGLGKEGLSAGRKGEVGQALQEARI